MEDIVAYVCGELAVISAVGAGQKLKTHSGTHGDHITVDNTVFPGLTRRVLGNSRETSIEAVKKIVMFGLELHNIYYLISHKLIGCATVYPRLFDRLEREFDRVVSGLNNLSVTYAGDTTVLININEMVDKIGARQASLHQ